MRQLRAECHSRNSGAAAIWRENLPQTDAAVRVFDAGQHADPNLERWAEEGRQKAAISAVLNRGREQFRHDFLAARRS